MSLSPLAKLLCEQGILSQEQLRYALRVQEKLGESRSLVQVLKELGYLNDETLRQALRAKPHALPLGELLVELGALKRRELEAALKLQAEPENAGKRLGEILVERHFLPEAKLVQVLADQLGFPIEDLEFAKLDRSLLRKVTPEWCQKHRAIPVRIQDGKVIVAFQDPLNQAGRLEAAQVFGDIAPAIVARRALEAAIAAFEASLKLVNKPSVEDEATAVRLVNELILKALEANVSDIHIEPMRQGLRVRFRQDGVLHVHRDLPLELLTPISARLKVLCKADITERRRHQGGGFVFEDQRSGNTCDVRVSFFVTVFGEKIVLRLLARKAELLDIRDIGMAPKILERFQEEALDIPSGVILITGPTGSGKTTTLYACVQYLNNPEHSIITAEDPVEYVIDGIGQCSINPRINLTFEETLKHMVRQDPDVIILGEVRDRFSAETAIQAALTGHKVLTTFHTEDSIGGLLRLMNMEIETFLISSTVVSVLAQRLLRRVCPHCAESYRPTPHELGRMGLKSSDLAGAEFRQGQGCSQCHYSGYRGRIGVHELLVLNEPVKEAILAKKTSSEIRRISVETSGLITLLEDGIAKAAQGLTTPHEILRCLPRLGKPRPVKEILRLVGTLEG
ncbi:MAG: ATPase, T2SS/T4P/T4SS family [Methylohalobius sp.]|nr:ATPase, T2SS/T4P/T4SS family [Methylohalobius sp.]